MAAVERDPGDDRGLGPRRLQPEVAGERDLEPDPARQRAHERERPRVAGDDRGAAGEGHRERDESGQRAATARARRRWRSAGRRAARARSRAPRPSRRARVRPSAGAARGTRAAPGAARRSSPLRSGRCGPGRGCSARASARRDRCGSGAGSARAAPASARPESSAATTGSSQRNASAIGSPKTANARTPVRKSRPQVRSARAITNAASGIATNSAYVGWTSASEPEVAASMTPGRPRRLAHEVEEERDRGGHEQLGGDAPRLPEVAIDAAVPRREHLERELRDDDGDREPDRAEDRPAHLEDEHEGDAARGCSPRARRRSSESTPASLATSASQACHIGNA